MKRIPLSKNFFLDEYIPKDLYLLHENRPTVLMGLIDQNLVKADQKLRNIFGPATINNWWNGGDRNWSGLRLPASPFYSPTSQHSFGRASDKLFSQHSADEIRSYIKLNFLNLGINCIEDKVTWLHSDVRFFPGNELLIVNP